MPSDAVQRVLDRLEARDCNPRGNDGRGWDARCPAHDDRNPSFHLGQGADGQALVTCHAGCTLDQIASSLDLDIRDLFEPEDEPVGKREVVKRYDYHNSTGKLLFQVERTVPKGFRQRRPDGNGGWIYDRKGIPPVLYHLPDVIAADRVVIVEGEKDADALVAKGVVATTNPGGAGKWRDEYSALFQGKAVAVIQDIDPVDPKTGKRPGQEHARAVVDSLARAGIKAKLLEPAAGKDVSEHLALGMSLGSFREPRDPRKPERLEILSAREIMELPDPDESGYLLGPIIYRGHRIVVGGWTGHGKTTFTMHMVSAAVSGREFLRPKWKGKGGDLKALVVDVEQGTRTVKRVLREVGLDKSDQVKYLRVPDGLGLDCDADAIAFMEKTFATGRYDIVLCDPLYKCHRGDPNDTKAATELMRRFDDWRERYEFALVLPMHCRKPQDQRGAPKLSPHDLFGSSAYQWGAEMLMGVERKSPGMTWVHWWKDREGDAAEDGAAVGSHWNVRFDRKKGYQRYVEGNQERLEINVAPTPKFDLGEFCYTLIRDTGAVTRDEVKSRLHQKGIRWAGGMNAIDKALESQGHRGVICNGASLKKDRVYQLQPELLSQNGASPDPNGAREVASAPTTKQEQGGVDQPSA
jgi:hypothetical protein